MYVWLKNIHVICAVTSISGFLLRGYWMVLSSPWLEIRLTRIAPHVIDTLFLLSGIAMLTMTSTNPLTQNWLLAKFLGLLVYIVLGAIALRRGRTKTIRVVAFTAAVLCFSYIAGVALSRSPASWLAWT